MTSQSERDVSAERTTLCDLLWAEVHTLEEIARDLHRFGDFTTVSELIRTEQAQGLRKAIKIIDERDELYRLNRRDDDDKRA